MQSIATDCCIAGGGPAGMMLGFLLARAGVDVTVLEKHPDFFRDFRGDTIHPSTLEMLYEVGLLERFLTRPHDELDRLAGQIGSDLVTVVDFRSLPTHCKFIAFMPQWDFLNFLREEAQRFPNFRLLMSTAFRELRYEGDRVCGVSAQSASGESIEIAAKVVVGADGRHSAVRAAAKLDIRSFGAPMDLLWMRIPQDGAHVAQTLGYIGNGHILVLINRTDYWQAGLVIPKGTYQAMRSQPVEHVIAKIVELAPFLRSHMYAIRSWEDLRYLEVRVDRLIKWFAPGLLCIGDAAHAMSPIGGVGINLAIQDAVATANALWQPLRDGSVSDEDLAKVQQRRMFPTVATQSIQLVIQALAVRNALKATKIARAPWLVRFATSHTPWPRLAARLMGVGIRPEHIQSPLQVPTSQSTVPDVVARG